MAAVHAYKRFENSVIAQVKAFLLTIGKGIAWCVTGFFGALTRQYTIVLVPHSEKKPINFRLSFLSVFFVLLFFTAILGAFVWFGFSYTNTQESLAIKDSRLKDLQANVDNLRDEIGNLIRQYRSFQAVLSETLSVMGIDISQGGGADNTGSGDLSSFFDIRETAEGSIKEVADIRDLTQYLASVEDPVKEIGILLASQSTLLTEIPNIWPIKGGIGHISMYFGQNENPFSGQYYIHKGIDLSTYRTGDPILATADGQVVTVEWDIDGFGLYVIIKHKHGFYTRYAHMNSTSVRVGQRVQQGDVIGFIGNTGLTTGPHLHYEVHIGSDVVDPYKYLNIRSGN
ncbi:MAG: M23 family metallopeptidase [Treponema sp.]|nr:M23 family metallopeptidase [Treponema sp.]